jgi:hypothetical protein
MIVPPTFYGKFIRSVWMMSLETGVVIEDELTTKLSRQLKYSTFFMINLKIIKQIFHSIHNFSINLCVV